MKFEKNFSIAYFRQRKAIWGVLETILITLLILLLAIAVHPEDPFSLTGPIPWLVFSPVLCSLLYGTTNGIISLIILLLYLMFQQNANEVSNYVLREYIVGTTALTMLVGIFSSYWLARIRHVEFLNSYVRKHLDDLSRDYYLLRISHDRLEHAYITKPLSFRDGFFQIRQEIIKNKYAINQDISQQLLNIFSQFSSINCAMFCLYNHKTRVITTMASLGEPFPVSITDSLIKNTIDNNITTYRAVNTLLPDEVSDYLAVIPLVNDKQEILGFIIIKEMPFWALTHNNMEILSVFAAIFSMQFSTIKEAEHLIEIFPTCTPEFLREFQILINLNKYNNVESALSGLVIPEGFSQENIIYTLKQQKRSLDYIWILPIHNSAKLCLTLMPLTNMPGIQGYKKRLADWLKSEFGQTINKEGLDFRYHIINKQAPDQQLNDFIKEFSYDNH